MARFAILSLLPLLSIIARDVLAQNPYIGQTPQCIQACLTSVIKTICGDGDDWYCVCTSTDTTGGFNAVQSSPQCLAAVSTCQLSDIRNLPSDLVDICTNQVIPAGPGGGGPSPLPTSSTAPTSTPVPLPTPVVPSKPATSSASVYVLPPPSSAPVPAYTGGASSLSDSAVAGTGLLALFVAMLV